MVLGFLKSILDLRIHSGNIAWCYQQQEERRLSCGFIHSNPRSFYVLRWDIASVMVVVCEQFNVEAG
jgi:hypothetical protein